MKPATKTKIKHEAKDLFVVFLYLGVFLCTLSTYTMLLLNRFDVKYFTYGTALINALVLAKVILSGEFAKLGKRVEDKPLIVSVFYKALVFSVVVVVLHVLEDIIKAIWHGENLAGALRHVFNSWSLDEILIRNLVVFCALVPF